RGRAARGCGGRSLVVPDVGRGADERGEDEPEGDGDEAVAGHGCSPRMRRARAVSWWNHDARSSPFIGFFAASEASQVKAECSSHAATSSATSGDHMAMWSAVYSRPFGPL